MALSRLLVRQPPQTTDANLLRWMNDVTTALNSRVLPYSVISTTDGPNSSALTPQDVWDFIIDVGSSNTTFWYNSSGLTTTWKAISFT